MTIDGSMGEFTERRILNEGCPEYMLPLALELNKRGIDWRTATWDDLEKVRGLLASKANL